MVYLQGVRITVAQTANDLSQERLSAAKQVMSSWFWPQHSSVEEDGHPQPVRFTWTPKANKIMAQEPKKHHNKAIILHFSVFRYGLGSRSC